MFQFLGKSFFRKAHASGIPIRLLQCPSLKPFSPSAPTPVSKQFLTDSDFLSPERALSVVKKLGGRRRTPRDKDAVVAFLVANGFSESHIADIVRKYPDILIFHVDSNIRPKVEFLQGLGFSDSDIADAFRSQPILFSCNLEKKIKPFFDFVFGISGTHETMLKALLRPIYFLRSSLREVFIPNVSVLRSYNVPDSVIAKVFASYPRSLVTNPDQFSENVRLVKEMGFDPSTYIFIQAVRAMGTLSRSTWEKKLEIYRSLGWSDDETLAAFRRHPGFVLISEEKIKKGTSFFMGELGWSPSFISMYPSILLLNLEKRIVPRHKVLQVLRSRDVITKSLNPILTFSMSEKKFLDNYVFKHQELFPHLMEVYQGEIASTIKIAEIR